MPTLEQPPGRADQSNRQNMLIYTIASIVIVLCLCGAVFLPAAVLNRHQACKFGG